MNSHVVDIPFHGMIESTLRQAVTDGVLAAADLTSEANAVAAIATKQARAHVSDKPRHESAKQAVRLLNSIDNSTALETGADLNAIYNRIPGTWTPGCSPAM